MLNCGTLTIQESRADREVMDLRGNYWGDDKTRQFDESTDGDVEFIEDYYDDFNLSRGDYSGYLRAPIENIGPLDESYVPTPPSGASYEIGDIGPGGGLIMYVDTADHVDTADLYPEWKYIEVLDTGSTQPFGYYMLEGEETKIGGTSADVGTGASNTALIVEAMGKLDDEDTSSRDEFIYAAGLVDDFNAGGYDWFLPSSGDAELIAASGLLESDFWTSTERDDSYAYYCSTSGSVSSSWKGSKLTVVMCRYF